MRNLACLFCIAMALTKGHSASAAPSIFTFSTKTYDQEFATGLLQTPESSAIENSLPRISTTARHPVPGAYSMRERAGLVENQGACGSCWDFSLTSVLRGTWMMSGRDPGRLSYNYLLNCNHKMNGCGGGSFSAAAYLTDPRGAPAYGSDGPYIARQTSCLPRRAVASAVKYHMLGKANDHPSFRDIAYVLGTLHRPVSVDVAADSTWKSYSGGIYNGCSQENPRRVNHMVAIEGYDCETSVDKAGNCVFDEDGNLPPGVGLWIVRNSWGRNWGNRGYIITRATDRRGQRCNAIASDALYFELPSPRIIQINLLRWTAHAPIAP